MQAQVLALLADIRKRLGLTMLFIMHDLLLASHSSAAPSPSCGAAAIAQLGTTAQVFGAPKHPYTRALLDSIPGQGWTPPVHSDLA